MPKISDVATVELQGPRPNVGFSPLSFWHYFRFPEIISKSYLNFQKVLLIYEKRYSRNGGVSTYVTELNKCFIEILVRTR